MNNTIAIKGMSRGMTLLFAFAGATAVGNLYWAQPLLSQIASDLGISVASSGTFVTATQLGYALGVLLLVPLGDAFNRRRYIPLVMGMSVLALLFSAFAPGYWALLGGLMAVGFTTISGQLLVPLAGDLARDDQRGTVIGSIASSMMIGIMLSRFLSGLIADILDWRAVYIMAAVMSIAFAAVLRKKLPDDQSRQSVPYRKLLQSIIGAVARSQPAQITLVIGACLFMTYMMFWSGLTFLLSSPAFSFTPSQIGLVNLFGLIGAIAAQRTGHFHDKGRSTFGTGLALTLTLFSVCIVALSSVSIALMVVALILFSLSTQMVSILNQTRLISISPMLRSRLNTAFVFCNFIAGAIGSALAGFLWDRGGWPLLTAVEIAFMIMSLLVWGIKRESLLSVEMNAVNRS